VTEISRYPAYSACRERCTPPSFPGGYSSRFDGRGDWMEANLDCRIYPAGPLSECATYSLVANPSTPITSYLGIYGYRRLITAPMTGRSTWLPAQYRDLASLHITACWSRGNGNISWLAPTRCARLWRLAEPAHPVASAGLPAPLIIPSSEQAITEHRDQS